MLSNLLYRFCPEMYPRPSSKRYTDFKLLTILFWSWISYNKGMFMEQSSSIFLAFVLLYKGLR